MVVLDFGVEASEIEAVGQVLFVDFAKVLISSRGDKLEKFSQHAIIWDIASQSAEATSTSRHPFRETSAALDMESHMVSQ